MNGKPCTAVKTKQNTIYIKYFVKPTKQASSCTWTSGEIVLDTDYPYRIKTRLGGCGHLLDSPTQQKTWKYLFPCLFEARSATRIQAVNSCMSAQSKSFNSKLWEGPMYRDLPAPFGMFTGDQGTLMWRSFYIVFIGSFVCFCESINL